MTKIGMKIISVVTVLCFIVNTVAFASPDTETSDKLAPWTKFRSGGDKDDGGGGTPGAPGMPGAANGGAAREKAPDPLGDNDLFHASCALYLVRKTFFLLKERPNILLEVLKEYLLEQVAELETRNNVKVDLTVVKVPELFRFGDTFYLPSVTARGKDVIIPIAPGVDPIALFMEKAEPLVSAKKVMGEGPKEAPVSMVTGGKGHGAGSMEHGAGAKVEDEEEDGFVFIPKLTTYDRAIMWWEKHGVNFPSRFLIGLFAALYETGRIFNPVSYMKVHENMSLREWLWRGAAITFVYTCVITATRISIGYMPGFVLGSAVASLTWGIASLIAADVVSRAFFDTVAIPLGMPRLVIGEKTFAGDYLKELMIKALQNVPIGPKEAEHYADKLEEFHRRIEKYVEDVYGDSEQRLRYIVSPREWRRVRDDFFRMIDVARKQGMAQKEALDWAFKYAIQNVYLDLFPAAFFEETPFKNEPEILDKKEYPTDINDQAFLEKVPVYKRAYEKLARGLSSGKPVLLIKDVNSFDISERVSDMYAREHKGVMVRVPVTPFTDRGQIIGTQVPQEVLDDATIDGVLRKAKPDDIKVALAITRGKITQENRRISEKEIGDDYKEWLKVKDTHVGLRRAVASALINRFGWNEKVTYEEGILAKMASLAADNDGQEYYLYFDNIDAASPKVRAQLNQILLFKEMEVPEKLGEGGKLKIPKNLHLIFTMSEKSTLEDAAFYDRFMRKHIEGFWDPEAASKGTGLGNLTKMLKNAGINKVRVESIIRTKIETLKKSNPRKVLTDLEEINGVNTSNMGFMRTSGTAQMLLSRLGHELSALIEKLADDPKLAMQRGYMSEAEAVNLLPADKRGDKKIGAHNDMIQTLVSVYGIPEDVSGSLVSFWFEFTAGILDADTEKKVNIGDLFRIAGYASGIKMKEFRDLGLKGTDNAWKLLLMREVDLYFVGKFGDDLVTTKIKTGLENALKKLGNIDDLHLRYQYKLNAKDHTLTVDGVAVPIDPNITDEDSLFDRTGLVLTRETVKVLSSLIREDLFGNGVICLEGATGAGKTYVAECYSKLTSVNESGAYKERYFYCEPINGSTRIDRWLGLFAVDEWGNYPFMEEMPFKRALSNGGVIAASELNARVSRDKFASLGYYLIPKARGDKWVYETEFPRKTRLRKNNIAPRLDFHERALVVIDINPHGSYAARGELPDFLKAFIPTVEVSGKIPQTDLKKLAKAFLRKTKLNEGSRELLAETLSGIHYAVQASLYAKKLGTDNDYALTIRELYRACDDIAKRLKASEAEMKAKLEYSKEEKIEIVRRAVVENYGLFWGLAGERKNLRGKYRLFPTRSAPALSCRTGNTACSTRRPTYRTSSNGGPIRFPGDPRALSASEKWPKDIFP
ncbi:MAG: hypothetical protein HQL30_12070 [Candidatus Omnitrophica bacterium]|nr:hypothetical protein [Candidatus Omnitrophota bacterium]